MTDARNQGERPGDYDYFAGATPPAPTAPPPAAPDGDTAPSDAPAARPRWVAGAVVIALAVLVVVAASAARSLTAGDPDPEQQRADTRLAMPSSIGEWTLARVDLDSGGSPEPSPEQPPTEAPLRGNYTTSDGRAAASITASKFSGPDAIDATAVVEAFGFVSNTDDGLAPRFVEVGAGGLGGEARCVVPGPDQAERSWTTCWFVNQAALVEVVVTDPEFDLDGVARVRDVVQSVA